MSFTHLRRTVVIATEITALVGAMLTSLVAGPVTAAHASPEQPIVALSIAAPAGITIDSPWVTDSTGLNAWALGVTSTGTGVLAKRDLATSVITTTPTVAGEIGASEGRLNPSTGTITFLAKRQGTGGRVVVINPSTGARVWTYDLPATDTNPRGIGFHSSGTAVYLGSNIATSQVVKLTSATGALSSSVNLATSPITAGFGVGTKMLTLAGTTAPRLIVFKDAPPMMLETTTVLTGVTQPLVDPVVVGNTVWLGTETGQARLVGVDFVAKTVVANFPLAADESALRTLAIPTGSSFAYGTTVANGHTRLVSIRLSDGAKLGSVDLGAITGATSVTVSGRYVDVAFSGAVSVIRLTTAAPPTAPSGLSVVESDRNLAVSWMPSVSSEPLVTYVLSATNGGVTKTCETTATTCSISGLVNGATYDITVTATTYAGSAASASITGSPQTVPGAPGGLVGTRGNSTVAFSWQAPTNNGGRPISGYTVTVQPGGATCSTASTTCAIASLLNGTAYTATVVAHSVAGDSAPSGPSAPVTPATVPASPDGITAERGNRMVTVAWNPPADTGGEPVLGYRVLLDGATACETTHTRCEIGGLTNGTPVSFTVVAANAVGWSTASQLSRAVIPATIPNPPTDLVAIRGANRVDLSWIAPLDNGGEAITGYEVQGSDGTVMCTSAGTNCAIGGLSNGTPVSFTVVATNAMGQSDSSSASAPVTPATVPASPASLSATRGNSSVELSWTAPADDGGEPVTRYTVETTPASSGCTTIETTCTVTGLNNGIAYSFVVVAHNAVGASPSSDSAAAKPATVPDMPADLTVSDAIGGSTLTWSAPVDGGDPVTGYRVTVWNDAEAAREIFVSELTATIEGIDYPNTYRITVEAMNSVGSSARATVWATPLAPPPPPPPPVIEPPVVEPPIVEPPIIDPPVVEPPVVEPPVVEPPIVQPPITEPPVTEPPTIDPPVVEPPVVVPPVVEPPVVEPPVVEPPVVEPPVVPRATIPTSPTHVILRSVTKTRYVLEWVAPNDGGASIIDYRLARRISGAPRFSPLNDGISTRRTVRIPRPANGKAVYVRITSVNEVGESAPATVVMLKGKRLYEMPSVRAVRFSDAAAFAGFFARSTPYEGTSFVNVFAHSVFL